MQVDRRTVVVLVVGLVGVSGIALSAATLTDPADSAAEGDWLNFGPSEESEGDIVTGTLDLPIPSLPFGLIWTALAVASLGLVLVSFVLLDPEEMIRVALAVLVATAFFGVQLSLLGGLNMGELDLFSQNVTGGNASLPSLSGEEQASPGGGGFSPLLFGAGALVVAVTLGVLFTRSGDEEALAVADDGEDERTPDEERLASMGEAAGRAAEGIAASDVAASNAVYEAWVEMTEALDVSNPSATTSGEFAAAAVEAGMEPDHVEELTRLFEEVRYGDASVSAERADRAREALERIEAAYAGDEV